MMLKLHSLYNWVQSRREKKSSSDLFFWLSTFYWLGILSPESSKSCFSLKKCIRFIYPLLDLLIAIHMVAVTIVYLRSTSGYAQITLTYVFIKLLSLTVWCLLRTKSESLKNIFEILQKLSESYKVCHKPRSGFAKTMLTLNVLLIIMYCAIFYLVLHTSHGNALCTMFFYFNGQFCRPIFAYKILVFANFFFVTMGISFFSYVVAFLYCSLCYRCFILIRNYKKCIERIELSQEYHSMLSKLVTDYHTLTDIVNCVQSTFSWPSLLVFIVSFCEAFLVLGDFLLYRTAFMSFYPVMEHACVHMPTAIFAFLMPAYAAQVSIEMVRTKAALYSLYESVIFNSNKHARSENLRVLKILMHAWPLQLSGGGLIAYTRSTVSAALGAILTYGLLILSFSN